MELPAPIIETIEGYRVVRDDKLPGGSKMRYLLPIIQASRAKEFIYASPAYGYAQIALAHAATAEGRTAVIFTAKRKDPHPRTKEAERAGAQIHQVPYGYLNVVQARAREYQAEHGGFLIPFGADLPQAIDAFAEAARATGENPTEVWASAGSGTLIRGLQKAWPTATFHAVRVGAQPNVGNATLYEAPEKYEDDAKDPPPFPSCSNYDAKVWQFMRKHASPGALFWNVAA